MNNKSYHNLNFPTLIMSRKKINLWLLIISFGLIFWTFFFLKKDIKTVANTPKIIAKIEENDKQEKSFDQKLTLFITEIFNKGYGCDDISWSKYFFDIQSFPYQKSGTYIIHFWIEGYYLTSLGNITSCGGGWETLLIKDNTNNIELLHLFWPVPWIEKIPDNIVRILKKNKIKNTRYEQAETYFHKQSICYADQICFPGLCDKIWYSVITNDPDILTYSTIPPEEAKENKNWNSLYFWSDHSIKEINRYCLAEWYNCLGKRENVKKKTLSYILHNDPLRKNYFEIVKISDTELQIRNLYH